MGEPQLAARRTVTVTRVVIAGLAVVGCGKGRDGGPSDRPPNLAGGAAAALDGARGRTTASEPVPSPADRGAVAPTAPPAPPGAAPEQVARDFYRAPGGAATFVHPRLAATDARWTHTFQRKGDTASVRFAFVDGPKRAQVEVSFPPRSPTPVAARALAERAAQTLSAQLPGATVLGGRELPLPGGTAWGVGIGAELGGAKIVAGVTAVVDDGAAVAIVTIAHAELYDAPAVAPMLDAIYRGVRVGAKVRVPPVARPGLARRGTYVGLGNTLGEYHVRIFDPRGYVYDDETPALDLDGRYQRAEGKVARYVATAAEIQVTEADGTAGDTLTVTGDAVVLERHTLCPAAATAGLALDGRWAASSFAHNVGPVATFSASASSRYAFAPDGRYSTSSTVSAATSDTVSGAPAVTAGGHDDDHGRYVIADDHLVLTTAGGKTARLPILVRGCGGTPNLGALVINGALYLQDD